MPSKTPLKVTSSHIYGTKCKVLIIKKYMELRRGYMQTPGQLGFPCRVFSLIFMGKDRVWQRMLYEDRCRCVSLERKIVSALL